jgi:hypothetical protein
MKKRRNTQLEAEGAEFLVVGWLLINGIEAHKMYSKAPSGLFAFAPPDSEKLEI